MKNYFQSMYRNIAYSSHPKLSQTWLEHLSVQKLSESLEWFLVLLDMLGFLFAEADVLFYRDLTENLDHTLV